MVEHCNDARPYLLYVTSSINHVVRKLQPNFPSTTNTYNGNIISDAIAGNTLEWNHLNLIKKVSDSNGVLVNYSYLADGGVRPPHSSLIYDT